MAQRNPSQERITSAKIGLITTRLNLNTDQAPQFWAVYNEYTDKKMAIRQNLRKLRIQNTNLNATDDEVKDALNQMLVFRQNEVDLEKEYMTKFLKTISPKQLAELYKTEQDFTKLLLERLEDRRPADKDGRRDEKRDKE
ncbi:hypothetical protein GXP67_29345 [Rhodocytophaga rosea]|uniref:Periplasmic heavy metal sensor n=2 Tax=Rhodocytophaga rosea TaxID=2704465 RepID=A0A6C0GWC6_9BACT|nr:hypothetical protein GXP67_29345 [Rhodocytophaga rosea]